MAATATLTVLPNTVPVGRLAGVQFVATPAAGRLLAGITACAWWLGWLSAGLSYPLLDRVADIRSIEAANLVGIGVVIAAAVVAPFLRLGGVLAFIAVAGIAPAVSFTAFAGFMSALIAALLTWLLLLGHELAHVKAGARSGISCSGVVITGFGAGAVFTTDDFPSPWSMFSTTIAGPLVNVSAAVLLPVIAGAFPSPVAIALQVCATLNLSAAVLNLLPVPPLDGGWVLASVCWRARPAAGHDGAVRLARVVGGWSYLAATLFAGWWGLTRSSLTATSWALTLTATAPVIGFAVVRVRRLEKEAHSTPLEATCTG